MGNEWKSEFNGKLDELLQQVRLHLHILLFTHSASALMARLLARLLCKAHSAKSNKVCVSSQNSSALHMKVFIKRLHLTKH